MRNAIKLLLSLCWCEVVGQFQKNKTKQMISTNTKQKDYIANNNNETLCCCFCFKELQ